MRTSSRREIASPDWISILSAHFFFSFGLNTSQPPLCIASRRESGLLASRYWPAATVADKVFTSRLQEGFCALSYPQTKETIAFHFNPQDVPYLTVRALESLPEEVSGLFVEWSRGERQGGWPSPEGGHFSTIRQEASTASNG